MKKKAFLQALILVILLTCSWMILLFRLNRDAPQDTPLKTAQPDAAEQSSADQAGSKTSFEAQRSDPGINVPAAWQEWVAYLDEQGNQREMRQALGAMRESLFSLPRDDARAHLLDLINSGFNRQTGMRFQIGRGGILVGAPNLQTVLLDWLSRLDPVMAAEIAKDALQRAGFDASPDNFVIHLRNYTRGSQDAPENRDRFILNQFNQLLSNQSWIEQPSASIAQAMDFAVFLGDGNLVRDLSPLMAPGTNPGIAHASSMAIERLMDIDPIPAASALVESVGKFGMQPPTRAGFLARLDPADPRAFELLTEYLEQPATSRDEAVAFLQYFPNLNKTFSNNLVSPEISITAADNHMERLKTALEAVQYWQGAGIRGAVNAQLESTEARLISQITGNPAP